MTKKLAALLAWMMVAWMHGIAQDTLPNFSAVTRGNNKVIISWTNTYPVTNQISIQRSADSTRNFKTILTVPDPKVLQNGFVDAKAEKPNMFYRLFIVLDSGKYLFTPSKRPFWDTAYKAASESLVENNETSRRVVVADDVPANEAALIKENIKENIKAAEKPAPPVPKPEKWFVVMRRDTLLTQVREKDFRRFRDSVVNKTKDTISFASVDTIVIKPFVPKEVYKPSRYVYTEKDGNVSIALPDAGSKKYSLKFFDMEENPLFEIKEIKESPLVLDKVNFLHAGWYKFELYEDGKLKEKHRFFIPRDF
jgi:hypothetical protein